MYSKSQLKLSYKGNTDLDSIPSDTCVVIEAGDLHVTGDVGSNVTIKCEGYRETDQTITRFGERGYIVYIPKSELKKGNIKIDGKLGNKVKINAAGNVTVGQSSGLFVTIKTGGKIHLADIGRCANIESNSGDIKFGTCGYGSSIKSDSGKINFQEISSNTKMETFSGNITGNIVENGCVIESFSGKISVNSAANSAMLKSTFGKVCANAEERVKASSRSSRAETSPRNLKVFD